MDFVVTVLSWAGWIWTAVFFAAVLPLLALKGRGQKSAPEESEAQADV
jgi:hypothetical protein